MSAEVILMNKNGIAIAADSAVTIGNKEKIYNTADKMFMLSKYAPIGILIYNNSSIMGIQMELIIKQYREKLCKKTFTSLEEYCNDFIAFCIDFCNRYSGEGMEIDSINEQVLFYCDRIFKIALSIAQKEIGKGTLKDDAELKVFISEKIDEVIQRMMLGQVKNPMSEEYYNNIVSKLDTKNIVEHCMNSYQIEMEEKSVLEFVSKLNVIIKDLGNWDRSNYTGIAITGFGSDEIFPSCIQIETSGIIDNRLIEIKREKYCISHEQKSQIVALAQTDVMNEFFLGINEELSRLYDNGFSNMIDSINDENVKSTIITLKTNIDTKMESIVNMRLQSIHNSLSFLPRDEMIYMAEGMINLTSFKRRLVLDYYSETVGGPIDVAFISKNDGFVWIKRKFYFDKDLNYVFFKKYFEKGIDNNEEN